MGATAALHARQIIDNVEHILSLELLAAAQGIDFRREKLGEEAQLGAGTRGVYQKVRQVVPFLPEDAYYAPFIDGIKKIICAGEIEYDER
jgi:histidine ammonia-lyase